MDIKEICNKTNLEHDGSNDDNRFFADDLKIDVYAPAIGYNKYRTMEKRIMEYGIAKDKYAVYVWNDSSGWKYWNNETEMNYIQITVAIENFNLNEKDIENIINDVYITYQEFREYDTVGEYIKVNFN